MTPGGLSAFFGKVVRKHRDALGLSQEQLAERAGIHRTYVGNLERGEQSPTLKVMEQIADGFELDLRELIDETFEAAGRRRG